MKESFRFLKNRFQRTTAGILIAISLVLTLDSRFHAEEVDEELEVLEQALEKNAGAKEAVLDAEEPVAEAPEKAASTATAEEELDKLIADEPIPPAEVAAPSNAPTQEKLDEREVAEAIEQLKDEPIDEAPPVAPSRPRPVQTVSARNQLNNLEFKMDGDKSKIVVSSRNKPMFREERNSSMKQIVYFFENTETPQRLQRAYDTTEFPSPVSLFTLLQMPGSGQPLSKLIIQLREDLNPTVSATETGLFIEFPPSQKKGDPKIVLTEQSGEAVEENIYASGKIFSGKRIQKLELKNADIHDALRLVAKTSGYNLVIGDDVSGRVGTMSLENVPWDQAFALLLQSKKLGYIRQGNVIRIATLATLTSEKNEALANEASKVRVEALRTVLIPVSYAKASEMAARAKPFMTDRGTVDTDQRTNTLIVRDVDTTITRLQKLFAALDTQPPSVNIMAKFVEVSTKHSKSLGFSRSNFNPSLAGISFTNEFNFVGNTPGFQSVIRAPGLANLEMNLGMGETEGTVKVLANPSVSVLANSPATLSHGSTLFVPTQTVDSQGRTTISLTSIPANLTLNVTPIVAGDGSIFLTVNINNDVASKEVLGGLTQTTVNTRNVNTQVLLENGDTAVIGGVFKDQLSSNFGGVPFLHQIPILGFFFGNSRDDFDRSELFIFLTAQFLNPEAAFRKGS